MYSILPFNQIRKGGDTSSDILIDTDLFINGSGTLELTGSDVQASTADGLIHFVRISINRKATFSAYENQLDKTSELTTNTNLADDSQEYYIGYMGNSFTSYFNRRGIMHGSFSAERQISTFQIVFDSETFPVV